MAPQDRARIAAANALVDKIVASGDAAYGINTGFGLLAQTRIPHEQLELLQRNLLLSHAAGVGEALPDPVVRLILALKINALARGHSGITPGADRCLLALLAHEVYPVDPAQGSVGASGDLAPLAHLSAALLGIGEVRVNGGEAAGRRRPAARRIAAAQAACQGGPGADQRHAGFHGAVPWRACSARKTCSPPRSSPAPCRSMR